MRGSYVLCCSSRISFNPTSHLNEQCILSYQPTQHVRIDESMVPYFGKHGAKQYIHSKPITFGFILWGMATPKVLYPISAIRW